MSFRVREVEAFVGKQVVIWLNDSEGNHGPGNGTNYCVVLPINEAPGVITGLVAAYAQCMQEALLDLAAGGCRTCNNQRFIPGPDQGLFDKPNVPCPNCTPRAEERIRKSVMLRRRR